MTATTSRTLIPLSAGNIGISATVTAAEWDRRTVPGGFATVTLSLPGSAPTSGPIVTFYVGEATGKKRVIQSTAGGTTAADYPKDFVCRFPMGTMFVNISVTGGTGNAVTAEAYAQELTTA